ncbi:MAG: DNA-directed RNA polymerase subunit omega [Clostridia bacterium]|nr:DNA-directed RNA polymerase subunit omega [Clostridia bacterium]
MIYPPIAKLVDKTGSRYTLVIEAAKRARQLSEGATPLASCDCSKEVSIATKEIYENKLEIFSRPTLTVEDFNINVNDLMGDQSDVITQDAE